MHIRLKTLLLLISPVLLLVAAAYIQWGTVGLPLIAFPTAVPMVAAEPFGFPAWLRVTHYVNLLFLTLLIRSGLQILMDHPRLYWNVHSTPGTASARHRRGVDTPRTPVSCTGIDLSWLLGRRVPEN